MPPEVGSPWIHELTKRSADSQLTLVCFPYLGGSADIFKDLAVSLPVWVYALGVQYPGRGKRFCDSPIDDIGTFVKECSAALVPLLQSCSGPWALLGYSMGGGLAYEMGLYLVQNHDLLPKGLFVAASWPKPVPSTAQHLFECPTDDEVVEQLIGYGGIPNELLQHKDFLKMLVPMYRADSRLNYTPPADAEALAVGLAAGTAPRLPCPVFAYAGDSDAYLSPGLMSKWQTVGAEGGKVPQEDEEVQTVVGCPGALYFCDEPAHVVNLGPASVDYAVTPQQQSVHCGTVLVAGSSPRMAMT
eukprot:gene10291-1860_t